ncbi:UDP-4-amino-4,6-dideoxy-N-acetyl-beta-L-altrosamine transaminase [Paracoccaceae bacterium]|nr:UDP-4-amino-4,6-dideoxy-N-acetyl-beta-L-altrosamine transaminase [Paracoccaceae bacterium]
MTIKKMIPYGRQEIFKEDIDAVVSVLKSDFLTQGPCVPNFQGAVENKIGVKFSCATNSATSALHISCLALGVGPGDSVWTSPNSFVASSNAALYCGASVDFIDINSETLNIDVLALEEKLRVAKRLNNLPKVVIPVHFAGLPCDMIRISELSHEYGFKIIEDASHALGASYFDKLNSAESLIGSCDHSDICVLSFHPIKMITTGEGGMATTNDSKLFERLLLFRSHGVTSNKKLFDKRPKGELWNYQQIELGFNYRMTDIHAALGISQLKKLDYFLEQRRDVASQYFARLTELPITIQAQTSKSSHHLYTICINPDLTSKSQKQAFDHFLDMGIGANLHYIPIYLQPFYENLGFRRGYCPNAEFYFRNCLSLPIFTTLRRSEIDYVVNTLFEFFQSDV